MNGAAFQRRRESLAPCLPFLEREERVMPYAEEERMGPLFREDGRALPSAFLFQTERRVLLSVFLLSERG